MAPCPCDEQPGSLPSPRRARAARWCHVPYTNAVSIDLARHHPDPAEREARRELVDLLTPISKAWCTDLGVDLASVGLQVHSGMGYVEETGVAQYLRDSRIAPIYEGTNGIQAIDLVLRKVPMRGGGVVADLLAQMEALGPELEAAGEELVGIEPALAGGVSALRGRAHGEPGGREVRPQTTR